MELKTQINILTSTSNDSCTFIWKDEKDLLYHVESIIAAFNKESCSETITPAKIIAFHIMNGFKERLKTYEGMEINLELTGLAKSTIDNIFKSYNTKRGGFELTLNKDELYSLFSLSEFRKSRLKQII